MTRVWIVTTLLLAGCFETSDTVPFAAATDVGASDTSTPIDTGNDASDDGSDTSADGPLYTREQLPRGTTCDAVPEEPPEYDCNPVLQDCPTGEVCELQIGASFRFACRFPSPGETFLIPDGGVCDESSATENCRLGAICLSGTCRAMCEFVDAVGCRSSEMCETLSDEPLPGGDVLLGYGACVSDCR